MSLNALVSHNNTYNNCICVLHAALTILFLVFVSTLFDRVFCNVVSILNKPESHYPCTDTMQVKLVVQRKLITTTSLGMK